MFLIHIGFGCQLTNFFIYSDHSYVPKTTLLSCEPKNALSSEIGNAYEMFLHTVKIAYLVLCKCLYVSHNSILRKIFNLLMNKIINYG